MTYELALVLFVVFALLTFAAFGMQRATLLLSREANTTSKATAMLLPAWFPLVWIPRISKWAMLFYIGFTWSWIVALLLLGAEVILSAILPIPYRLYFPAFRKRAEQIRSQHAGLADSLQALLAASRLNK